MLAGIYNMNAQTLAAGKPAKSTTVCRRRPPAPAPPPATNTGVTTHVLNGQREAKSICSISKESNSTTARLCFGFSRRQARRSAVLWAATPTARSLADPSGSAAMPQVLVVVAQPAAAAATGGRRAGKFRPKTPIGPLQAARAGGQSPSPHVHCAAGRRPPGRRPAATRPIPTAVRLLPAAQPRCCRCCCCCADLTLYR